MIKITTILKITLILLLASSIMTNEDGTTEETPATTEATTTETTETDPVPSDPTILTTNSLQPSDYTGGGNSWPDPNCKLDDEKQSPIDILEYQSTCTGSHTFEYKVEKGDIPITIKNDPTSILFESNFIEFFFINLKGEFLGFQSQIVKFRSPSEHYIDGKQQDVEMQIYGKLKPTFFSLDHEYAVFSILMQEISEEERKFKFQAASDYTDLLNLLKPWNLGEKTINFSDWFDKEIGLEPTYFYYEGSLTEPPCAQQVPWIVLDTIFPITTVEKLNFANMFQNNITFAGGGQGNNRAIKTKGDRTVYKGGEDCSIQFSHIVAFIFLYVLMMYFIFKLL